MEGRAFCNKNAPPTILPRGLMEEIKMKFKKIAVLAGLSMMSLAVAGNSHAGKDEEFGKDYQIGRASCRERVSSPV